MQLANPVPRANSSQYILEKRYDACQAYIYPCPPRIFVLTLLFLLLPVIQVRAASIEVNSNCSLADAITSANDDSNSHNTNCTAGSGADTITLTANVVPTDLLPEISSDITIDGGNFSISHFGSPKTQSRGAILRSAAGSRLTLHDLTLEWGGGGTPYEGALQLGGDATVRDVSIGICYRFCVRGAESGATFTFERVVFYFAFNGFQTPAAIWARAGAFNMTDTAFRDMRDGGDGLIRIESGASVTLNGCLYINQVLPKLKTGPGTLTNNTDSFCSGTIGNGETLPVPRTTEAVHACGLYYGWPAMSVTEAVTRTVELSADCDMVSPIYVPHNLHLTVSSPAGQRYAINGALSNHTFNVGGRLTLRNVDIVGRLRANTIVPLYGIQTWHAVSISLEDVTIRSANPAGTDVAGVILTNVGEATLTRVTIQDHLIGYAWQATALTVVGGSNVLITDSTFSNNRGGSAAIRIQNAASRVHLAGTNTFTDNVPVDIHAHRGTLSGVIPEDATVTWFGVAPPPPPPPDSGGGRDDGVAGGAAEDDNGGDPTPTPMPRPRCFYCPDLLARGFRLNARYGLGSGVEFRRLDRRGIGNQSVLEAGFRDAVDVWGYAEQGVEVCFPGTGSLILLDATTSPRAPFSVDSYTQNGMTCAAIDRPGTLVLVANPPANLPLLRSSVSLAPAATAMPAIQSRYQPLDGCMVTTHNLMRFRDAPGGAPLQYTDPWGRQENGWLPGYVTLTALERTADWFHVDYYGARGWVSALYVTPHGVCG